MEKMVQSLQSPVVRVEDDGREEQYILQATEIISQVLKDQFAPYLSAVVTPLLKKLAWKRDVDENAHLEEEVDGEDGGEDDSDDDIIQMEAHDGRQVNIRTRRLEEMDCVAESINEYLINVTNNGITMR